MTTATKALITWNIKDDLLAELEQQFPQMQFVRSLQDEEIDKHIKDADIVYAGLLQRKHMAAAGNLKWLQLIGHGADPYLFPETLESDIKITNSGQVHAIPIAEHVFAMMLNHSRKIVQLKDGQRQGKWIKPEIIPHLSELHEKVIAIAGIGNIGVEIAKRAKAFGMKVMGIRRTPDVPNEYVDEMFSLNELKQVLQQADYVVLTLPGTQNTIGLIGEEELACLKDSAYLINVGRGNVLDEQALIRALQTNKIAGAGLDVFITEPLPSESAFYGLDRVLLSPHVSGVTPVAARRTVDIFKQNVRRFLSGDPLINLVDKSAGY